VNVRIVWRKIGIAEIRAGKDNLLLDGKNDRLPVNDAVAEFVTHRNARGLELIQQRLVHRKLQVCARLNNEANGHACVVPSDDLIGKLRQLDHIKLDVDSGGFGANEIEYRPEAVFKRRIAQPFLRGSGWRRN